MVIIPRRSLLLGAGALAAYAGLSKEAKTFWQSRDSNYNQNIASSAPSAMSLVLASASSQFLSRSWGSAPTNGQLVTINAWVKFTSVPTNNVYWYAGGGGSVDYSLRFNGFSNVDDILDSVGGSYSVNATGQTWDNTTWHNFHYKCDSTQATANNRLSIFYDGTNITNVFATNPTQNVDLQATPNGRTSNIGQVDWNPGGSNVNGKLAYVYLIDGQALDPSSFTTGTGAGTIRPITYAGTYGTNGFLLNFSGSNTNDQSGNTNNWTQNGSPTFDTDLPT